MKTANSGKEAIKIFEEFQPDIALLDIGLPDIDGYELCRKLSLTEKGQQTIFLSQSGWGSEKDIEKTYEAGFKEHFVKPLNTHTLLAALKKYTHH